MRVTNIISWIAWCLTILGIVELGVATVLTTIDTAGVVREPWGIIGPGIWLFLAGVAGMVITKVLAAILAHRQKSKMNREMTNDADRNARKISW